MSGTKVNLTGFPAGQKNWLTDFLFSFSRVEMW